MVQLAIHESIHGIPSGNISGALHFTARRVFMGCMFACDYFLWGYLQGKVYTARPRTIDDIKMAIRTQISAIPEDMERRSLRNLRYSFEECVRSNGQQFCDVLFKTK
jgi:hypothetical protein